MTFDGVHHEEYLNELSAEGRLIAILESRIRQLEDAIRLIHQEWPLEELGIDVAQLLQEVRQPKGGR